jgi:predicted nucleic acid-binding protein
MSPVQEVCIDASIAVKVVVTEPDSDKADALFDEWANDGTRLIAPAFFDVEIDSILRQKVVLRQELIPEQAETAWTKLQNMPIEQLSLRGQRRRAWEIAVNLGLATVYDATYLALAELRRCEFWTADERLLNRVKGTLSFVKWLGDYMPGRTP